MLSMLTRLISVGLLMTVSTLGSAHTSAVSTNPKSGSVLEQSPPSVAITFKDAVRMTSVLAVQEGKPERKLESSPQASATVFTIANPQLETGRTEIRWIALSKDGHVIKGVIELTLKAAASKAR
jgi:methionine-rich copper-binding protein CopC